MDEEEEIKNSSGINETSKENNKSKTETEEEIEIEEIEEVEEENNEEDEDNKLLFNEEKTNTNNTNTTNSLNKTISKEKYLLDLKENGLPDLPNNKILSCNINSLINISLYNGLYFTSNIALISDSYQLFPSHDFIKKIIQESEDNINNNSNDTLDNNYFINKLNPYMKYPSLINTKIFFQIRCERAGNITFLFMYKDNSDNNKIKFTKPFYILVNPIIEINKEIKIELNQIRMQTIISKNIGKIENDFEDYFQEASLLGYNFIHFKAIQSLSSSDNIYSIKDHTELNDIFFETKKINFNNKKSLLTKEEKNEIFQKILIKLTEKYNLCSITDVILTQTSTESEWILNHTECAYNLDNTPWLNAAYKLDEILVNYSNNFANKKVGSSCAPFINNLEDLNETMEEIEKEVNKNNLEEYFLIPIQEYMDKFQNYYEKNISKIRDKELLIKQKILIDEIRKEYSNKIYQDKKKENDENNENDDILNNESIILEIIEQNCIKYGYKRYGVEIPVELISLLIIEKYRIQSKKNEIIDNYEFLKQIRHYISTINKNWYTKSKEMIKVALLNIKELLKYQFIQKNNRGIKHHLIDSYFHVIDKNDPKKILLCNGWIMQSDDIANPFPDITSYGVWYYFKRKVIIWKDTIKINYGENIEKTPEFLLDYITKYVTFLAKIFEGLYIESLVNVPSFILKYLIYKVREINPNIILVTQLPNIDEESNEQGDEEEENSEKNNNIRDIKIYEKKYSEELGINLFVHEIIWDSTNVELNKTILNSVNSSNSPITSGNLFSKFNSNLYSMSKSSLNKIYFGTYKYLTYHKPFSILYDLTSDNQSYYEKYNILSIQKSISASIGLLDNAIGSTRGFDQLYPYQISSQNEQRLYFFENNKIKNLIKKVINIKNDDPNLRYQDVIFELNIDNVLLNDNNYMNQNKNNIFKDIKTVKLALSFHKWIPDVILDKIGDNVFMKKIQLPVGKHYYKYVINDNLWVCDSSKPVEVDDSKNMNNLLDLNNINFITIQNLTLLRCYLNALREKFNDKKSEIFLQKNNGLFCVIRMVIDTKSLINNHIDDDILEKYKNNLNNSSFSKILNDNSNNINKKNEEHIDIIYKTDNTNINYNKLINEELSLYEGYAIITSPSYNIIDENEGKGEIIIPGKIDSVVCSFSSNKEEDFDMNNILDNQYLLGINANISFNKDNNYLKRIAIINYYKSKTIIRFHSFPPNSVLVLKFSLEKESLNIIEQLNKNIELLFNKGDKFVNKFYLSDINKILYQTEEEEREWSFNKRGCYELNIINKGNIENKIKFIYSGVHQIMDIIKRIKKKDKQILLFSGNINNDKINNSIDDKKFIESLYNDISQNDNLLEYLIERISNIESFILLYNFIKENIFHQYKKLPYHIKSLFFESIIISLYQTIIRISLQNMPYSILNFGEFSTALILSSFQFYGKINPKSSFIRNISRKNSDLIENISISKGLPFNVTGTKRMYFRDTLISFKSLFLISNNFQEGKKILKIIGSTLRHGLIPDMFDEGEKPRYNSRDTCWLFIKAIKDYISYTKDYKFLKEEIELLFLSDINYNEHSKKKEKGETLFKTIEQIIHIIFQSHAKGINFTEWDYNSKSYFNSYNSTPFQKKEGYNIKIDLDPNTGFIYGGNYYNNGTWMNNLGISSNAKNKGVPATPRPGADIEIIALLYCCLDFVVEMGNKNYFRYKSVKLNNKSNYPYSQWRLLIKDSFEDEFYVKKYNIEISNNYNNECSENPIKGNIYKDYINKNNVNIYEFQLRPNFLLALYFAPDLFSYNNVINAINNVEKYLLRNGNNVMGLKTLDKTDKEYNGIFNKNDTNIFYTSCGFNIHNGIEHTWLYGIYLILKLKYFFFENKNVKKSTPDGNEDEINKIIKFASSRLITIMNAIKNNKWFGLPEMSDELGNVIKEGNQSDLKSMAIFLELMDILSKLNEDNNNYYNINDNEYSNDLNDNSNIDI